MRRHHLEKLLGGYATGTLTEQERRQLFQAALEDQSLFNALADEQALKELLQDPRAKRRLLQALEERPGLFSRAGTWFRLPAFRAVAGGLAVAALAVTTVTRLLDMTPPPSETTEDSSYFEPASRRVAADKLLSKKKQSVAPRKSEPREPAAPETKDADVKQNTGAERQMETVESKNETAVTEQREADVPASPERAMPGAKADAPAEIPAPPAKTAPKAETPVPSQSEPLARLDLPKSGARDLFYGKSLQKERDESVAGRLSAEESQGQKAPDDVGRSKALSESASQGAAIPLGLRYSIARSEPGSARVQVEVNHNAYLYAFFVDRGEAPQLLFPNPLTKPGDAYVEKGGRYLIPSGSTLPLRSEEPARVILVLTREPLRNLPEVTASSRSLPSKSRVIREERDEQTRQGSRETVTYAVDAASSASSSLSVELVLPAR